MISVRVTTSEAWYVAYMKANAACTISRLSKDGARTSQLMAGYADTAMTIDDAANIGLRPTRSDTAAITGIMVKVIKATQIVTQNVSMDLSRNSVCPNVGVYAVMR